MTKPRLPRVVWLLGLVSLCTDLSSEMIHSLLPVFLVSVLGASTAALGLIEGIAEATASIAKVFSGVLSDRFGRRKPLVVLGYGLAALSKLLFPLATSAGWVLGARFTDRIGKGIRGAPRDALLADVTEPEERGAAYGLRQSLDTAGAVLGPVVAIVLMSLLANDVRSVFWIAVLPAFVAVGLLVFGVEEPASHAEVPALRTLPHWRELQQLGSGYWTVVAIGAVITLARFSEAFLVLRAHDAGLSFAWSPLALIVMNVVYFASAYPAGWLSDRVNRVGLLMIGLVVLVASDLALALSSQLAGILLGIALWGLHMGLTQGLLTAMIANTALPALRGSAFGVFYFISGIATLLASFIAGALWAWHGPPLTFFAGAIFSSLALLGLFWWRFRFNK